MKKADPKKLVEALKKRSANIESDTVLKDTVLKDTKAVPAIQKPSDDTLVDLYDPDVKFFTKNHTDKSGRGH